MNLLMIEFKVAVVYADQEGLQKLVGTTPTYISMSKIKYFHKIDRQFATELCNNSGDVNPDVITEYTVFHFGGGESVLIAESFDDIVAKLSEANTIFNSRRIHG